MSTYTPPPGNAVPLDFVGGPYTPPAGNAVPLEFRRDFTPGGEQYVFPDGLHAGAFGTTYLRTSFEYVGPLGIGAGDVGAHTARNAAEYIDPPSISGGAFGYPSVVLRTVFAVGIAPGALGAHWVSLGTRRIEGGLGDQTRWGTAELAGGVRWLDLAGRGIAALQFPAPRVWFSTREVLPAWFVATLYGEPQVDHHHPVYPAGWDSLAFGAADVHVPREFIDLMNHGIAGPLWGEHRVSTDPQIVAPDGIGPVPTEHERFGRPEVWPWVQYVEQLFEVTPYDGGVFGNFNLVENRNQTPRPEGWHSLRFGSHEVYNNARIVATLPNQDMSLLGDTMVSHFIRSIHPQGDDASRFGTWTQVYNGARVLAPHGFDAAAVGTPERVWSNLQWMDHAGGDDHAVFGEAMVAFAIRTVAPYSLPEPAPLGLVTVENWERYIETPGLAATGIGVPTVEERFTIIAPNSVLPPANQVGDSARVWNVTPELHTFGWTHTEWGTAQVFNEWEAYEFQGFRSTTFGSHVVRDRRSWIAPNGIASLAIGPNTEVRNVDPDPPGPQTIEPHGWVSSVVPLGAMLRANSIYPQGDDHARYGAPLVTYMGISPVGITPPYDDATGSQFGIPNIPRAQYIAPTDERGGLAWTEWGRPQLWPHYIWAPRGYPYTSGDETDRGHIMDFGIHGWDHPERPVFGIAAVTHRNRVVYPDSIVASAYGDDGRVSTNPQYVRPDGTRHQRFGFPVVNGGGIVDCNGFDMARIGEHVVMRGPYLGPQTIAPAGIVGAFGEETRVEFLNREVSPSGFVALQISPPAPPVWPFASTWVSHEYPPFEMPGFEATRWGDATWVSHYIRYVEPVGTDTAIVCDYEPGHFADRMRVRRRDRLEGTGAGDTSLFGTARVEHGERTVRPRTIREDRVGVPKVQTINVVTPGGWESALFGDVQEWEEGKIKPHGDDMALFGQPRIDRALHAEGFEGVFGDPVVGPLLRAQGFDASAFGDPVAIARWCGDRAMAVRGDEMTEFGTAEVTT